MIILYMDNYQSYLKYIEDKYNMSKKVYKKKFTDSETDEMFLIALESMNVYPVYPRPIIMPLKLSTDNFEIKKDTNKEGFKFTVNLSEITQELNDKIKEYIVRIYIT